MVRVREVAVEAPPRGGGGRWRGVRAERWEGNCVSETWDEEWWEDWWEDCLSENSGKPSPGNSVP